MINIIKKYSKYSLILFASILLFLIVYVIFKEDKITAANEEEIVENIDTNKKEEKQVKKIKFDIKGAIKNAGVYELDENSRVIDAIEKAGGLTKDADTSYINLSKHLTDEMTIIIYTKQEIKKMSSGDTVIKYIEKECNCPKIENDACIKKEENSTKDDKVTKKTTGKISINKATLEELQTLTGIGKSKAEAIIKYREENNGFKSLEEITNISGIGVSTYEKFKDNITL